MVRCLRGVFFFFAALTLNACGPDRDLIRFNHLGDALREGMNERDVVLSLNGRPGSVELKTCGDINPWQCRIYNFYYYDQQALMVFFVRYPDGEWRVNNWSYIR